VDEKSPSHIREHEPRAIRRTNPALEKELRNIVENDLANDPTRTVDLWSTGWRRSLHTGAEAATPDPTLRAAKQGSVSQAAMKSGTEKRSLADIGEWPRIEIGSHRVIRHAYENVLNACARLASFSTGGPTTTDGPISRQQEILAVDDLVSFAIHARRLLENTASPNRFRQVTIRLDNAKTIPITSVINVIVHHKLIVIVRDLFQYELFSGRLSPIDALIEYCGGNEEHNKQLSPIVIIRSAHKASIPVRLLEIIETFQLKILNPVIDICAEHNLYLDLEDEDEF
jgi:hypothetical protein